MLALLDAVEPLYGVEGLVLAFGLDEVDQVAAGLHPLGESVCFFIGRGEDDLLIFFHLPGGRAYLRGGSHPKAKTALLFCQCYDTKWWFRLQGSVRSLLLT